MAFGILLLSLTRGSDSGNWRAAKRVTPSTVAVMLVTLEAGSIRSFASSSLPLFNSIGLTVMARL